MVWNGVVLGGGREHRICMYGMISYMVYSVVWYGVVLGGGRA